MESVESVVCIGIVIGENKSKLYCKATSVDTEMCCPKGKCGCQYFILLTSHNRLDLIQSLVPPHYVCNGYISGTCINCFLYSRTC